MDRSDTTAPQTIAEDLHSPVSPEADSQPRLVRSDYDGYARAYWFVTVLSAALIAGALGIVALIAMGF